MSVLTPHQIRALNIDKSISLTANAGSGKTFVLAQRYLEIILNNSIPLNKVAAITFTEKSAGELYKRISVEIDNLLLSVTNIELKYKIEKIRKQLVSAKISTIHSFCIDLLKEFPVEASLDASFNIINEQKASELIDLAIQNTLNELLKEEERNSDVKKLIRLLGSRAKLSAELSSLIGKRKNILNLIERYYSSNQNDVSELLFRLFKENVNILFENEFPEILTKLKSINNCVLKANPTNELADEINLVLKKITNDINSIDTLIKLKDLSFKVLTQKGYIRTQGYLPIRSREKVNESIEAVEEFFSKLNTIEISKDHRAIEKELARYTFSLLNVFKSVLSAYEKKKSDLGVLDFEDILLKANSLLQMDSVIKSISGKYKFLLVDEYQDTNEIQYEIFLPLVEHLRNGNLFIVGDEKQGIYRFRDAELQVFSKTKNDILNIHGKESLLTLPDSFRMAPLICLFVNSLFRNLFREPQLFFNEVSATDLICARSDNFQGKVEFLVVDNEESSEAELVAKKIISLKSEFPDRLKNWNDIAVLVRKRVSFSELQKAFIKYQIPLNLIGGTGFYQKQSISDIYNYFAFLLNDKDDSALIGILRSPFFLVSDVKLFELSTYYGETFWEKMQKALVNKGNFWTKIFETLNNNKHLATRISIPTLLRKILRESKFISIISSRVDGSQEISNINKLISITNDFFINDFSTLYDYVTFLSDSISGIEDEAQSRIEPGSIGVNIMTIHQSKGLEFPAVFLYKCDEATQLNKVKAKSFTVDKDFGILTKVPVKESYFEDYKSAPVVGIYNLIEEKKELAELKRLLYVGNTRAKDFLFISLSTNEQIRKKHSFSSLLKEGVNLDLSKDELTVQGDLTFLQKDNNSFVNLIKQLKLEIPITREIESQEIVIKKEDLALQSKQLMMSKIINHSKGEVISATRFSTFLNCPMKYNFLYNYKIGDLIQRSKSFTHTNKSNILEDYNLNELETQLLDDQSDSEEYSKFKGEMIHYVLRKNIKKEKLSSFVEERIENVYMLEFAESFKADIIDDLNGFFASDEFKFINNFSIARNEFEIYLKEDDYYLFGILDRLIIDKEKLIIIDYKTDNITENGIISRVEKYLPQLKFYAYIVSRLFGKSQKIEGRIIFIKHPNKPYIFNYNDASDSNIKSGINSMIFSIRNNNYSLNLNSCNGCIFSVENSKCIKTKFGLNYFS